MLVFLKKEKDPIYIICNGHKIKVSINKVVSKEKVSIGIEADKNEVEIYRDFITMEKSLIGMTIGAT